MFKKLCPWCGNDPKMSWKLRRKFYAVRLKEGVRREIFFCKHCENLYRVRFYWLVLWPIFCLSFALIAFYRIDFLILAPAVTIFSITFVNLFFPYIWYKNREKITYEYLSKKVQIRWVERENGGLSLPRLRVLTRDVFLIEPAPDAAIPEENPAHFIVITKFFSRKKGTAEMAYLVPNALPDEFFLLHKKRRIAHCRVIANGTKKIRIPPGIGIIVYKLSQKTGEWE